MALAVDGGTYGRNFLGRINDDMQMVTDPVEKL